jgi:hypothetical protein
VQRRTAASGVTYKPIGDDVNPFIGQFDGFGHVIDGLASSPSPYLQSVGGLFGSIGATGVVRNVGVTNAYISAISAGLLAGQNAGLISNTYSTGSLNGGNYAGGLVGRNDGTIERSWSSAAIRTSGEGGGLVGLNRGSIVQSFATGTVYVFHYGDVGGLAGDNSGTISQSYSTAGVTGGVGGAGGLVSGNGGTITQSFAAGSVSGAYVDHMPASAGIASWNTGTIANDVYWDVNATGRANGVYEETPMPSSNGLATAEMSTPMSFASWDFSPTGTWAMPTGAQHPVLRWSQSGQ